MKSTIASCIREEMEKGGGTARETCARLNANPAVRKKMKGKEVRVQTVATTLHKADIKRNARGWCKSEAGRPLRYSLTTTATKTDQVGACAPDALEALAVALLPTIAGAMQVCLQVLTARTSPTPGSANLADVLAAAVKNCAFPLASSTKTQRNQKHA